MLTAYDPTHTEIYTDYFYTVNPKDICNCSDNYYVDYDICDCTRDPRITWNCGQSSQSL
jgi:hypothetical protein